MSEKQIAVLTMDTNRVFLILAGGGRINLPKYSYTLAINEIDAGSTIMQISYYILDCYSKVHTINLPNRWSLSVKELYVF